MLSNIPILKYFTFLGLLSTLFIVSNCTKVADRPASGATALSSPFTLSSEAYLSMANSQFGEERNNLLIMAAGRSVYDGQWQKTADILTQMEKLSPTQGAQKNILLAKVALMQKKAPQAIRLLSHVNQVTNIPRFYQTLYHEVLANAYTATGRTSYVIVQRIKLEGLLPGEAARVSNRRHLWLMLTKLPIAELNTLALEAQEGSVLQGWLQLALIARQGGGDGQVLLTEIARWQQNHLGHPGNAVLPSPLAAVKPYLHKTPSHVALLLPLSGPFAGPGNAVKDGFLAAYRANAVSQQRVSFYDTASADVVDVYEKALKEGADYIVGPLVKNEVARIAALSHPVPILLLNEGESHAYDNAYHFGLSPTNEARQVAVKANKAGLRRALVIAPAGSWGNEIVNAFSAQWQALSGTIVERLSYDNQTNLNQAVRNFLHVSQAVAEQKQIKPLPGQSLSQQPKRRQDFDLIFLLAYPSKARQIMPLLRYYFAGDVPVYATSSVYAGNTNTMQDKDLDGIIFCDMPWIFTNPLANKNWPEQFNSYGRLYAMGMDSYALSKQLNQLFLFPAMGINDKSGVLYLNRVRQVARLLAWGRFKGGVAHMIDDTV